MFVFLHDNRQPDPDEVERVHQLSQEVHKKRLQFESNYVRLRHNNSRAVLPTSAGVSLEEQDELDRLANLAELGKGSENI